MVLFTGLIHHCSGYGESHFDSQNGFLTSLVEDDSNFQNCPAGVPANQAVPNQTFDAQFHPGYRAQQTLESEPYPPDPYHVTPPMGPNQSGPAGPSGSHNHSLYNLLHEDHSTYWPQNAYGSQNNPNQFPYDPYQDPHFSQVEPIWRGR